MISITFKLYIHTIDYKTKWITFEPTWHTQTIPTLDDVYHYLPEWIPFFTHMSVSYDCVTDHHYVIKCKYKDTHVFEITCYTSNHIFILAKWATLTYNDLIRVLGRLFKLPVHIQSGVNISSYIRECTRTMYYVDDIIILY